MTGEYVAVRKASGYRIKSVKRDENLDAGKAKRLSVEVWLAVK